MSETVSVVCLGQAVKGVVCQAVETLNCCQRQYLFRVEPEVLELPQPDEGETYYWGLLRSVLLRQKQRLSAKYLLGVLEAPIENNWFSYVYHKEKISFITTRDWDYLSSLPVASYVAFELVENFVEMSLGFTPNHEEMRGCLSDMCVRKPDISFKIRTADICHDCKGLLSCHLPPASFEAVVAMLEGIRCLALGRGDMRTRVGRVTPQAELADRVDRDFPFPIAYCFRSMQAELSYSRKWLKMLEIYEVTIKYLTFVMLAALHEAGNNFAATLANDLAGLRKPSAGHWHRACFALMKHLKESPEGYFIARFLKAVDDRTMRRCRSASEVLIPLRNATKGHGFIEEDMQYRARYEEHLGEIRCLIDFVSELAGYRLIKVGEGLKRRQGISQFPAKVLMGSHPIFPVEKHETSSVVDTECLLFDPNTGKYLSLYPWLLLDHCKYCFRETVFVYDKLDGDVAVMREYPTNHVQSRADDIARELMSRLPA